MDTSKVFRRDVLRRMVEKGNMEARTSYNYDGKIVTTSKDSEWKPARVMGEKTVDHAAVSASPLHSAWLKEDWKEGYWNFNDAWFKSKSGAAWQIEDNLWEITWAGTSVELRKKA